MRTNNLFTHFTISCHSMWFGLLVRCLTCTQATLFVNAAEQEASEAPRFLPVCASLFLCLFFWRAVKRHLKVAGAVRSKYQVGVNVLFAGPYRDYPVSGVYLLSVTSFRKGSRFPHASTLGKLGNVAEMFL